MSKELNDEDFDEVLRRSFKQRPEIPGIEDLVRRSMAKAASIEELVILQRDRETHLARARILSRALTAAAIVSISLILFFVYETIPDGSVNLGRYRDAMFDSSSAGSFASSPQLCILVVGALTLLISIAGSATEKDSPLLASPCRSN